MNTDLDRKAPNQFNVAAIILSSLAIMLVVDLTAAQESALRQPIATSFRLERTEDAITQRLFITVNGKERRISNRAIDAWLIDDGRSVVYSGPDGSGGYENEGQSLRIYNVRTRRTRKVLSEYTAVVAVMDVKLSTGQQALLVRLGDGGLGASYFAVVDPRRGEVFFRSWAELIELKGDRIKLGFFKEDDWGDINEERSDEFKNRPKVIPPATMKPRRTETHDLRRILRRRVIYNPRSP